MRRSTADAILTAYRENAKPNLPANAAVSTRVPLLVNFSLGDLIALERSIEEIDRIMPETNKA